MFDAIKFLEALAQSPAGFTDVEIAEAAVLLEPDARTAVEARDAAALGRALRIKQVTACYIEAPDSEEPASDDAPANGDEEPVAPDTQAA